MLDCAGPSRLCSKCCIVVRRSLVLPRCICDLGWCSRLSISGFQLLNIYSWLFSIRRTQRSLNLMVCAFFFYTQINSDEFVMAIRSYYIFVYCVYFFYSRFCLLVTVKFHIAHTYEIQGKSKTARDTYESLLKEPNLSVSLKADIYRQLGYYVLNSVTFINFIYIFCLQLSVLCCRMDISVCSHFRWTTKSWTRSWMVFAAVSRRRVSQWPRALPARPLLCRTGQSSRRFYRI